MTIINRLHRRQLEKANAKLSLELVLQDRNDWPREVLMSTIQPLRVWKSRHFMVYEHAGDGVQVIVRLGIMRNDLSDRRHTELTWADLQAVKNEVGYHEHDALELFPVAFDVVQMDARILWVMNGHVTFAHRHARHTAVEIFEEMSRRRRLAEPSQPADLDDNMPTLHDAVDVMTVDIELPDAEGFHADAVSPFQADVEADRAAQAAHIEAIVGQTDAQARESTIISILELDEQDQERAYRQQQAEGRAEAVKDLKPLDQRLAEGEGNTPD